MFVVISLLALTPYAHAQVTSGEILGVIRDPDGAPVDDAKVIVRNLETNDLREVRTCRRIDRKHHHKEGNQPISRFGLCVLQREQAQRTHQSR